MDDSSAPEYGRVRWALASDPELADGLRPLLADAFGPSARRLVLHCLARRAATGAAVRGALLPALADALRAASGDRTDTSRGG